METETFDIVVVGGGLAGFAAAVSAARLGVSVALVHNRPVLGGNSSSEVRVPVGGACDFNPWARESGILEEFFLTERTRDPRRIWLGETPSLWDLTLYEMAKAEPNLTLHLNTSADSVSRDNQGKIRAVGCSTQGNEARFEVTGTLFIDATGDAFVAAAAGAEYRFGREGREEFGEQLAPPAPDDKVMGSSLLFHAEDAGVPVPFVAPEGTPDYVHDRDIAYRTHDDVRAGYWWIEVGNPPYNTVRDNELVRDELYRQLLAVWNHVKNRGEHGAANLHIDFVGAVPGKRESRRIVGDHIMTQHDIQRDARFHDAVAYGGWFCDLHVMGGILTRGEPPEPSFDNNLEEVDRRQMYTYSIPLRSLYSRSIENLMMAGRDISVSHVALGSTRLMATCAVIGQAAGTAAALCIRHGVRPRELAAEHAAELQQQLLRDDCYIPGVRNEDPFDRARHAEVTASSSAGLRFPPGMIAEEYEHPKQRSFPCTGLETERAQLFPCSDGRLTSFEVELQSTIDAEAVVRIRVYRAPSLTGFSESELLFETTAAVAAESKGFLPIACNLRTDPGSLLWISLRSQAGVHWLYSFEPPTGSVSASRIVRNWKPQKGSYSLRLEPESRPYQCSNLLSGVSRPETWTNIWVSDPGRALPAWVEYSFRDVEEIDTVYLTFDTNVNLAHMSVPGLYRAPECVRDYRLEILTESGKWIGAAEATGNYQRRRVHRFARTRARAIRLAVLATNGDPSARLYELRAYCESGVGRAR